MSEGFNAPQLAEIAGIVSADLATSGIDLGPIDLYDGRTRVGSSTLASSLTENETETAVGGAESLFASANGHWMRISAGEVDSAAAAILWNLQDDIVDLLGRGWPEIHPENNASPGIAVPKQSPPAERSGWYLDSTLVAEVGKLDRARIV